MQVGLWVKLLKLEAFQEL